MPRPVSKGRDKFVHMVRQHYDAGPDKVADALDAAKMPIHLEGKRRDVELVNLHPKFTKKTCENPWTIALESRRRFKDGKTLRSVVLSTFRHALPRERQPAQIEMRNRRDTAEILEKFEARTQARGTPIDFPQLVHDIVSEEKRQHADEERQQQAAHRLDALLNYDEKAFLESLTPEERSRVERDRREGLERLRESQRIPWWER